MITSVKKEEHILTYAIISNRIREENLIYFSFSYVGITQESIPFIRNVHSFICDDCICVLMCLPKYMIFFFFLASRIRYEITSGNIGGAFAVKNMTGAIYVAGALDYETRKRVSTYLNPHPCCSQTCRITFIHTHSSHEADQNLFLRHFRFI